MVNRARARRPDYFHRAEARRTPGERVLIVCEGSKTEPRYLRDISSELGLTTTDVRVCGQECGSASISVVEYAINLHTREPDIEHVFCVFDRDEHASFDDACRAVKEYNDGISQSFSAIRSDPCFEYWLLIHFREAARPYTRTDKGSRCANCIGELKDFIPEYDKRAKDIAAITFPHLDVAIGRAERRKRQSVNEGDSDPWTEMHQLIGLLQKLALQE